MVQGWYDTPHCRDQAPFCPVVLLPVASIPRCLVAAPPRAVRIAFQSAGRGKEEKGMSCLLRVLLGNIMNHFAFNLFGQNLVIWPQLAGEETRNEDFCSWWHDLVKNWGFNYLQKKGRMESGGWLQALPIAGCTAYRQHSPSLLGLMDQWVFSFSP